MTMGDLSLNVAKYLPLGRGYPSSFEIFFFMVNHPLKTWKSSYKDGHMADNLQHSSGGAESELNFKVAAVCGEVRMGTSQ